MKVCAQIRCEDFPCAGVNHSAYLVPDINLHPAQISIVLISEAAPPDPADHYYAPGEPLFAQTTVQAFRDAGADVTSIQEILDLGVYMTTAVKCGKVGYTIKAAPIKECSLLLERELALFPNLQAYLLMGDVAIRAMNYIARRSGEPRVIPAGSTYKIRGETYTWRGRAVNMIPANVLGNLLVIPLVLLFGAEPLAVSSADGGYLLLLGGLVLPVSFAMITLAPRYLPAPEVSLILLTETILGPLWVWFFLAEVPQSATLLAGLLIVGTLLLHTLLGWRGARLKAAPEPL